MKKNKDLNLNYIKQEAVVIGGGRIGPVSDFIISCVGLIPIAGPFIQIGISGIKTIIKLYLTRAECFESKLKKEISNNLDLLINDELFSAKLLHIWNSVRETHIKEKIEKYASLFNKTYTEEVAYDEFDELVQILDNVSLRDIKLLAALNDFNRKYEGMGLNDAKFELWRTKGIEQIADELNISTAEVRTFYTQLLYKGMCNEVTGFLGQTFLIDLSTPSRRLINIIIDDMTK